MVVGAISTSAAVAAADVGGGAVVATTGLCAAVVGATVAEVETFDGDGALEVVTTVSRAAGEGALNGDVGIGGSSGDETAVAGAAVDPCEPFEWVQTIAPAIGTDTARPALTAMSADLPADAMGSPVVQD